MTFKSELKQRLEEATAEVSKWTEWEKFAVQREIREVSTDKTEPVAEAA